MYYYSNTFRHFGSKIKRRCSLT
uniref:Uncharacterized protein n=1 Tax=Arundo donax TaxID=35708 RepID=A0A0A9GID7_ARUDO